jgi:hypothetical protein
VFAAATGNCPDAGAHCQQYGSSAALTNVYFNKPTPDPYASQVSQIFQTAPPLGVKTGGVAIKTVGSGYTNGSCTFTISGGTYYGTSSTPATFTATIKNGKVSTIGSVSDPGAYSVFPTSPVSATSSCGGSGATFNLTEGCFTWISGGTPIAGRKYCSINLSGAGTTNFPTGTYYIAGGDASCVGFCVSSANATVTSDTAGVTFLLTNGEGTGTYGTSSYAQIAITSGTVSLCAPGTNCGKNCVSGGSCMLFVQNPAALAFASLGQPTSGGEPQSTTDNTFSGNGTRTLSGLIYLPKQTFDESGNGPINGCVGVIAKYFDIGGTPTFSDGCLPGNGIGSTTTTTTTFSTPYLYQ